MAVKGESVAAVGGGELKRVGEVENVVLIAAVY